MGWFPLMKAFFLVSYCFYQVWLLPLEIQLQAGSSSGSMMTRLRLVSTLIIKFHGLDFQQLKAPGCKNRLPLLMRKNKSKRLKHKQSFGAKAKLRNLSATFPSPQLVVNSKYLKSPIRKKEQLPVPGKGGSSPLQTLLLHSLSVSTQGQGVSW